MILFDKLKNKRSSLQEVKDDTTGRSKKPIKVNLKNLVDKAKKNPLNKNLGVKITDDGTNTVKQSEVSKKAKEFTKDINKKRTKKVFPGDKSGAYKAAKDDLEARKGFNKNKSGGLKADEKNPFVKRSVRKARVDKLGGDILDQPKFSQKKFDKSIKKLSKGPATNIPNPFGKGDTKGQMNVKGLEAKAFKKTQPKDVKLPKSFTDFSKKLKTLKTDVAKTSSSTPRKITKKFTPTVGVKQSEVSKKAQEFTTNINQKRQTTTPSKSDVERIKQNKIETKKAEAFKKTAAYRNIVKGTDAQGNYLTPEQRKAKFIKQTKQNKKIKNTTLKPRKDKGTYKTSTGDNRVTTGRGRGVGSGTRVTSNKDFTTLMNNNKIKNTTTGKKKVDLPKFGKKSGVTNPSFMKKVMPKFKKAATPAAKAFSKAGPVGKLAAAALVAGGAIYGGNQIRKAFAGAGKPKTLPAVKGSALRYTSGSKKGQKKYFDIKTMKKDYFTKSDFRDSKGNIDAGFGKPDRDEKLIKRLKSTK